MGVLISHLNSFYDYSTQEKFPEQSGQVFGLAQLVISPVLRSEAIKSLSHMVVATTCPDSISPSLGQMLLDHNNGVLSGVFSMDLVQGCAGGVAAMILGSQLAEASQSTVLVVNSDAARKATSVSSKIHGNFGNGAFACLLEPEDLDRRLIYHSSKQYQGLSEVVSIRLGHDADQLIMDHLTDMKTDPRKHLGLSMQPTMAIKLMRNAERFFQEFVAASTMPDWLILHQVNPMIIAHLKSVFSRYPVQFVDVSRQIGNCGAATVGIAFDLVKDHVKGKKVMLCSFGTGGVITAGMWQN